MRIVRRIFWIVMFLLLLLGGLTKEAGLSGLSFQIGFCVVGWWFVGFYFSRWIGAMLVGSLRCKGCGLEIPAVGRWRVGSFNDHRDRHFLLAKNPIDGARVGHIDCPQCSTTIIV